MPARWSAPAVSLGCLLGSLAVAGCGSTRSGAAGAAADIECVPYARQASGIALYGDAAGWGDAAAGRYPRSTAPQPGAVLVFRRTQRLPHGHVGVVTEVASGRQIVVGQANWVHHRIGAADPVVDVSPDNDWSAVRVWWAPAAQLGATVYPTYGFVGPASARADERVAAAP